MSAPVPGITAATVVIDAAGTPTAPAYGDIYHSAASGPGQARHVFLRGNDLPARWAGARHFTIVETGFGLGLNFLATWAAWRGDARAADRLHFVSIERHPLHRAELISAQMRYPEFAALAAQLQTAWPPLVAGTHRLHFDDGRVTLTLVFADVADAVRGLRLSADAFYLDGFAPDRNPAMWTPALMRSLARLAAPNATLATYTTARSVRDALGAAGFAVDKRPGFGGKRDMLGGRYAPQWTPRHRALAMPRWSERHAIVIGAGLAGAAVAERLANRGWRIDLIEQGDGVDAARRHLLAGILQPHISRDDCLLSRFTRAGFFYQSGQEFEQAKHAPSGAPARCGVLQLAANADAESTLADSILAQRLGADYARYVGRSEAQMLAGCAVGSGGVWFPGGGWLRPAAVIRARLRAAALTTAGARIVRMHAGRAVAQLMRVDDRWRALDLNGAVLAEAPVVVLANAGGAADLAQFACGGLQRVRGQLSYLPAPPFAGPRVVVSGEGYVLPPIDGIAVAGATYDDEHDEDDESPTVRGHRANLARAERLLPGSTSRLDGATFGGAVGFRCIAPDRMPLVGAVVDVVAARGAAAALTGAHADDLPRLPGLYASFAFASRGLAWTALAAESIASHIEGEPAPLEAALLDAIDPGRFALRRLRRRAL